MQIKWKTLNTCKTLLQTIFIQKNDKKKIAKDRHSPKDFITKAFVGNIVVYRHNIKTKLKNNLSERRCILPFTFYNTYLFVNWNKMRVFLYRHVHETTLKYTEMTLLGIDVDSLLLEYT
jgi:hypothetical protein